MKPLSIVLALSLVANGALAALVLFPSTHIIKNDANLAAQTKGHDSDRMRANAGKAATPWSLIQTENHAQFIKNLKAAGLPDEAIYEIVIRRIGEKYQAKYRAIRGIDNNPPYWRMRGYGMRDIPPEAQAEIARLGNEQRDLEQSLFPQKNSFDDEETKIRLRRRYGDLPDDKMAALESLQNEQQKRLRKMDIDLSSAKTLEERQAALKLLNQTYAEQKIAIEKLLSPDELLEYNLRMDRAAQRIRFDTPQFGITENEFRALYPIYKTETDQLTLMQNLPLTAENNAAYEALRAEAETQRNTQIKDILGPDRYADYRQAIDPTQKKLNLIVQRLELPLSAARAVTTVQIDIAERAANIDANTNLTREQRSERYKTLAAEAQTSVTKTLGVRGYAAYRENSSNWIQYLEAGKLPQK